MQILHCVESFQTANQSVNWRRICLSWYDTEVQVMQFVKLFLSTNGAAIKYWKIDSSNIKCVIKWTEQKSMCCKNFYFINNLISKSSRHFSFFNHVSFSWIKTFQSLKYEKNY